MARMHVSDWQQRLQHALPQARAVVCRDSRPAADTLRWQCDHVRNAAILIKIGWGQSPDKTMSATAPQTTASPGVAMAVDF